MTRKNYSFYMPEDFKEKIQHIKESDDRLKPLSSSQAVYFIISELCQTNEYKIPKAENE